MTRPGDGMVTSTEAKTYDTLIDHVSRDDLWNVCTNHQRKDSMRTVDKQVLQAATAYVKKGLPVFPVHKPTDSGCSCRRKKCDAVGKHPAIPGESGGGLHHATLEAQQVKAWFGDGGPRKGYNIGIACGTTGYICLDVDPKNGGTESFQELVNDYDILPDTWTEETGEDKNGNRGLHYWFTVPQGTTLLSRKPLPQYPGIDLLSSGSYAIVAPSLHASGVRYDNITDLTDVTEVPEWLADMTAEQEEEDILFRGERLHLPTGLRPGPDVRRFLNRGEVDPGGQRAMACKAARALWGIWMEPDEAADLIYQAIEKCEWEDDPWTENQIKKLVVDEYTKQPKALDKPASPPGTDVHRAEALAHFSRGNLLFSGTTGAWYTWDATAWRRNGGAAPRRMVHAMARKMYQEAQLTESDHGSDIRKEALKLQNTSHIDHVLKECAVLEDIHMEEDVFDKDAYLLNCENCVVDLRTGNTMDQKRDLLMTRHVSPPYYEDAKSDLWDEVLDTALQGDQELIDYLQLAFGYAATADTREDTFFYMYGPGGTSKTTILEAVANVMGGYAQAADPETFMLSDTTLGASHRADLAVLRHARLVTSSEINKGAKFSTSTLNRLTGRDMISARVPYAKEPLTFKPKWTLFFAANHFPAVPGATKRDGFWRRVKVIPFVNKVPQEDMNPALPFLLSTDEHAQAILTWVVDGAIRWWKDHASKNKMMPTPKDVLKEVEEIQQEEDPLRDFVETLVLDEKAVTFRNDLYDHYKEWCDRTGVHNMHPRSFVPALRSSLEGSVSEREMTHDGKRGRWWVGVGLPIVKKKGKMRIN